MSRLIPGQAVIWQDRKWILMDIPSVNQALLRDPATGKIELVASEQIRNGNPQAGRNGLMAIAEEEWSQAWKRFEALRPLLERSSRDRSYAEIDAVAKELGKDRTTVYRWIAKWNTTRTVSSLIRSNRSDLGKSRLPDEVERIMSHEIEAFYLTKERPTVVQLWERITLSCRELKIPGPNLSTVRRRVARLSDRTVMATRFSSKKARETFEPLHGSFPGADVPLAVYQIDHTPIDVSLVDDIYRQPIGRAYLTIVIDTCTRMLAGFCVTFDPPGALATGLAMTHAILPKAAWLAEYDLDGSWPIHGLPAKIFADNAKEFRGTMLERASQEYDIVMENRPKGLPNYGGHVERLFRTFMKRTQSLPGSTFSNIEDRGEYVSDNRAVMTLREYTRWFATFVTKVYHQRPHRGIGRMAPATLYEKFILGDETLKGIGLPEPINDPFKLRLDFMPFEERTIQEYGVVIDNIHYYADVLRAWVHARDPDNAKLKRKFVFARDPRDIGEIYFFDPEAKRYYPIPYRDLTRPRMSVWELRTVLKHLAEDPSRNVDENTIFEGLAQMHQIQKDAGEKTRATRRAAQRAAGWKAGASTVKASVTPSKKPAWVPVEDVKPFDDIEEAE